MSDYTTSFGDADHVLVTDIYAAREAPPPNGFSSRKFVEAIQHQDARYSDGLATTVDFLLKNLHSGSVLIVLSAGDADQVSAMVLSGLKEKYQDQENQ